MSQSLSRILVHLVFSTKDRKDWIRPEWMGVLHAYLARLCEDWDCHAYRVGGTPNHVHLAVVLARTRAVADLVRHLKRHSSVWTKRQQTRTAEFAWQGGYGAFSIGQSQLADLVEYVGRQERHHRKMDFKAELRALLEKYNVDYDERYLWD